MKKTLLALMISLPLMAGAANHEFTAPTQKTVQAGEIFTLELPANPTTGYGWIIRTMPAQIALLDMSYQPAADCNDKTGCRGTTTLRFKAVKTGKGALKLQYARPWEPLSNEAIQMTRIEVKR